MLDLKDFIATRKLELEERRDQLQSELQPILAELQEIALAERAMSAPPRARRARTPSLPGDETIKGRALKVLTDAGRPMTAAEVLEGVQAAAGREIDRTTFSPQLSRLCAAGLVARKGLTYCVAPTPAQDAGQDGEARS